jgi:hypothetical protein
MSTAIGRGSSSSSHHDAVSSRCWMCDKELHEGGTCTCDLIGQYGPPSDRDNY